MAKALLDKPPPPFYCLYITHPAPTCSKAPHQNQSDTKKPLCPPGITQKKILIRGAGDIATGIALFLLRQGIRNILLLEQARPLAVRRFVCFAQAVFDGTCYVEEAEGTLLRTAREVKGMWAKNMNTPDFLLHPSVPLLVDENAVCLPDIVPDVEIEATLSKRNAARVCKADAPLVIGIGPGFLAGNTPDATAHVIIETNRGPNLGTYIEEGTAEADTGEPAPVMGFTHARVVRAPAKGIFTPRVGLGASVQEQECLGFMEDKNDKKPVFSPIAGRTRGLIHSGVFVDKGAKIGDIEPRTDFDIYKVSDKALVIGQGVYNAICKRFI